MEKGGTLLHILVATSLWYIDYLVWQAAGTEQLSLDADVLYCFA